MKDAAALTDALSGVDGIFVMMPPIFDPTPGFPEARAINAVRDDSDRGRETIHGRLSFDHRRQATQLNLLNQLGLLEQALGACPSPVCFLRAAWFMENAAWDVAPARDTVVVPSFLRPLDKPVPMVATADIGRFAATLLQRHGQAAASSNSKGRDASLRINRRDVRRNPRPPVRWKSVRVTPAPAFESQNMKKPRLVRRARWLNDKLSSS